MTDLIKPKTIGEIEQKETHERCYATGLKINIYEKGKRI